MVPGLPSTLKVGNLILPLAPLHLCLWDLQKPLESPDTINPEEVLELSLRVSSDSSGLEDNSWRLCLSSFMAFWYSFSHSCPHFITSSQQSGHELPLRLLYELLVLLLSLRGLVR